MVCVQVVEVSVVIVGSVLMKMGVAAILGAKEDVSSVTSCSSLSLSFSLTVGAHHLHLVVQVHLLPRLPHSTLHLCC